MSRAATPPGAYLAPEDHWGTFAQVSGGLGPGALVVADRRVLALHPALRAALRARRPLAVVEVPAGERTKSLATVGRVLAAATALPRKGTLVAVGGGTVGDTATVAAHLLKRGVRLVQMPTTLLAAVDSSLGGKGAVNVGVPGRGVKNAAGVFHYAEAFWLCPEVFATLDKAQVREGLAEAWKMAVTLDAKAWAAFRSGVASLPALIRRARALKAAVCAADPYERVGQRQVLNFGHTLGHLLESLSGYRVRHGEAVALGMLCALDVGRALGVTPVALAAELERAFLPITGREPRGRIAQVLRHGTLAEARRLLGADKKVEREGSVRMILLQRVGATRPVEVPLGELVEHVQRWRRGEAP
jgi:3-dehydroquinate synthase